MAANPKTLAKEALRWLTIIAAGGFGLWQLADAISHAIRVQWTGDATNGFSVFFLLISLLMAAPFLAVAYFCLRRQYRKLFLVLGVVGGVVIFAELHALPDQLGVFQFHMADRPNREIASSPSSASRWPFSCSSVPSTARLGSIVYAIVWHVREHRSDQRLKPPIG